MSKRVAIVQSNYIPWKGYFDLINRVDEFILLDSVQYTPRDWRNRNRIKMSHGLQWLSIPVQRKGRSCQRIDQTKVKDTRWARKHWQTLQHAYGRASYFKEYAPFVERLYVRASEEEYLSRINFTFLCALCDLLGIRTRLTWSTNYRPAGGKTERLVSLCRQAGATEYVSGPSARSYLEPEFFERASIQLSYMDYSGYPEYPQIYPPFEHAVTILDLIFSVGPDAPRYLLGF